jgi:hypothetical protein
MYHSQICFLFVGGSVWYMVRNLRRTVKIDSVLANSKKQTLSYSLFTPCSSRMSPSGETCKYASRPSTQKKLGEIRYLLICSFLLVSVWVVAQPSSEVPEGLVNYPVVADVLRDRSASPQGVIIQGKKCFL